MTFREDGNHTLEKQASYNLNIMRKLSLNIIKDNRSREQGNEPEKEAVCNRYKSRETFGANNEFVIFYQINEFSCETDSCVCRGPTEEST